MSVNTCLIYRCLSSASAVIRSWFIYELQKSTTIAFSRNSLYTFYSRNPTCGIPPCLRISNRKYPPCPQNSIIVNPPSPSEILKAVRGIVWIVSGIPHLVLTGDPVSFWQENMIVVIILLRVLMRILWWWKQVIKCLKFYVAIRKGLYLLITITVLNFQVKQSTMMLSGVSIV